MNTSPFAMASMNWPGFESAALAFCLALWAFIWQGTLWGVLCLAMATAARRWSIRAEYALLATGLFVMPLMLAGHWIGSHATAQDWIAMQAARRASTSEMHAASFDAGTVPHAASLGNRSSFTDAEFPGTPQHSPSAEPFLSFSTLRTELNFGLESLERHAATVCCWIASLYVVGVALVFARMIAGWRGCQILRGSCEPLDDDAWAACWTRCVARVDLKTSPELAMSSAISTPLVFGLCRPIVLIPAQLATGLSVEQIEAVLLHELMHLRRRDPWVAVLQRVSEAAGFIHPMVWWISRRLDSVREECCDADVVAAGVSRVVYAESLLVVAESAFSQGSWEAPLTAMTAAGRSSELRRRIERLFPSQRRLVMNWKPRSPGRILLGLAVLVAGPWFYMASAEPAPGSRFNTSAFEINQSQLEAAELQDVLGGRFVSGDVVEGTVAVEIGGTELVDRLGFTSSFQPPAARGISPDAIRTLTAGDVVTLTVEGTVFGAVWGSDVYTTDSTLGAAAVHAGALNAGETGRVRVEIVESPAAHLSSTRHGVTSSPWGTFSTSMRLSRAGASPQTTVSNTLTLPAMKKVRVTLNTREPGLRNQPIGTVLWTPVKAGPRGFVWGSGAYTTDSSVDAAAVHAGLLKEGDQAEVEVRIIASPPTFLKSFRNGVQSREWTSYPTAFEFTGGVRPVAPEEATGELRSAAAVYQAEIGESFLVQVTGQTTGTVWGTNVYTTDSNMATAAVHSGAVASGESAQVVVTIVPSPARFVGSVRNGVTTYPWSSYPKAFVVGRGSAVKSTSTRSILQPTIHRPEVPSRITATAPPALPSSTSSLEESAISNVFSGIRSQSAAAPFEVTARVRQIVGRTEGDVWGSGIYTGDSDVAAAAVHEGLVKPGETGNILQVSVPTPNAFAAATKNGVATLEYGAWPTAYILLRADGMPNAKTPPASDPVEFGDEFSPVPRSTGTSPGSSAPARKSVQPGSLDPAPSSSIPGSGAAPSSAPLDPLSPESAGNEPNRLDR